MGAEGNSFFQQKQFADELVKEAIEKIYSGELKAARGIALRAKDIYAELGERREEASTKNVLSIIYDEMGNETLYLENLLDALEIALENDFYDVAAKMFNNLGSKLLVFKSYDRALIYIEQAEQMVEKAIELGILSDKDKICFVLIMESNLAMIHCLLGNNDQAREHYNIAKELSVHPKNSDSLLLFKSFEILILHKLGEEQTDMLLDELLEMLKDTDYSTNYLEILSYIFVVLNEKKEYDKWEKALQIMTDRVNDDVELYVQIEMLKFWLEFYDTIGNTEKYKDACVKFYELSKAKTEEDNRRNTATIELEAGMRRATKEKERTDKIVFSDALTGIGNRNKMLVDSKAYIEESIKTGAPITVGLMDIDYFKECNDTYGHIQGDECLKIVARVAKEAVGDRGCVYRYGGDEFLILVPNMEKEEEVVELGRTIKENLEKAKVPNEKSPVSEYVTVSQGYTTAVAEEGDTIESLVKLADRVLYHVKRFGRNNYEFCTFDDIISKLMR